MLITTREPTKQSINLKGCYRTRVNCAQGKTDKWLIALSPYLLNLFSAIAKL